jgi:hypothetical protein
MVLNLPLDECIDNTHTHTYSNLREKKKNKKKETATSDRKPKKGVDGAFW